MTPISHIAGQNDSPNPLKPNRFSAVFSRDMLRRHFTFIRYITAFDYNVLAFAVGISFYFSLSSEPRPSILLGVFIVICGFIFLYRRIVDAPKWMAALVLIAAFISGPLVAGLHSQQVSTTLLPDYNRAYDVTGWVEGQDRGRTGPRWMIRVQAIEGMEAPPKRLRIRGRGEGVKVGDFITVRTVAKGPPPPATPDGYNSRRAAFFQGLGGSGYAVTPIEVRANLPVTLGEAAQRRLVTFRYGLAKRIEAQSPDATSGLQAALITGLRQDIPRAQVDALRASGLAHILAISGLHMALFAGSFYSLMSWLLAGVAVLARGRDVRKFAAFAGIAAASFYLLISGASVATQRAYIMAVILFLAVILDRQALSTRSVSIAALATLWLHPESLLSVGFQMSFAAVLALVVVYRHWSDWKAQRGWRFANSWMIKLRNGMTSLAVTSFVAGLATGLFAIMQFQRWAKYGLLGNLAAMPLFTFLVMPMALVTFLVLPFGLERFPLWVMGQGLEPVIWVAQRIEALPEAMLAVKKPPSGYVAAYAVCFLLICLGRAGLKVIGGGLALILAFIWLGSPVAVLRVSDQGRVTWRSDEGVYFTLNRRADRFGRDQFLRQNGNPNAEVESTKRLDYCDKQGCHLRLGGQSLAIIETPDLLLEACEWANLIIIQKRAAGPRARFLCKAEIIDPVSLGKSGSIDFYIGPSGWTQRRAKNYNASRPWD